MIIGKTKLNSCWQHLGLTVSTSLVINGLERCGKSVLQHPPVTAEIRFSADDVV